MLASQCWRATAAGRSSLWGLSMVPLEFRPNHYPPTGCGRGMCGRYWAGVVLQFADPAVPIGVQERREVCAPIGLGLRGSTLQMIPSIRAHPTPRQMLPTSPQKRAANETVVYTLTSGPTMVGQLR